MPEACRQVWHQRRIPDFRLHRIAGIAYQDVKGAGGPVVQPLEKFMDIFEERYVGLQSDRLHAVAE